MELAVLGPLEVRCGGVSVAVGGSRERAVLTRLLLSANQVVSLETLAEDLWAGEPPEGAAQALWVYISRLRKALRSHGGDGVLLTRPPGYLLAVESDAIDVARFEGLVAGARKLAADDDQAGAGARFREALALWRGPALADVADLPFARAEAARLEEARLSALEERIHADLACGRHGELVGELAGLTRDHPVRERFWAQRMIALYRVGRQTEALRTYQDLRRYLGDELGIEPAEDLRRLESAILRHDPELDWTPGPTAPAEEASPDAVSFEAPLGRKTDLAVPLPVPLERDESSTFVGRDREMAALEAAWAAARSGRRRLVLVVGEPGIGKTRLAAEIARQCHGGGGTVLFGCCDEGTGVPYQPFVEALGAYVRQARMPALGRLAGELVRLVPEIPHRIGGLPPPLRSDPETERYRLFDAVAAWLAAVSAGAPVLLVLDDLHWATQPTLSLLGHLVRSGETLNLLVVASCRDSSLDVTAELADATVELLRHPGVDRLRLSGLDEGGVAAFIEAQARHELDEAGRALSDELRAETGGNPFFVGQMLRHLGETGAVVRREGRWVPGRTLSEVGLPESVRDVIARRLARLPDETRETLAVAAVIGDGFELAPMVHASGETEMAALRALDPAIAARLVTEAGASYRFVHALVRATLYDGLPGARRVELHRRVGEAVEALRGDHLDDRAPTLARHFARAGLTQRGKACVYAAMAGDGALAQFAHDEAAGWYTQALELLDQSGAADESRRCDLLISLGEAQRRAGDPVARETLLDAARRAQALGDPERLARAALANHPPPMTIVIQPVDTERTSLLQAALASVAPTDSTVRARLLATLAGANLNSPDHEHRYQLAAEAVAMARRLGDPATLAYVLVTGQVAIELRSDPAAYEAWISELVAVGRHLDDPALEFWGASARWWSAVMSQDLPAAIDALGVMRRLGDDLGQPAMRWTAAFVRSAHSGMAGRFDDADSLAHEAFELASAAGLVDAARILWSQLFWIRYDQGRMAEVLDVFARAAARERARSHTRALLCVILCELERLDDARPIFDALAADDFAAVGFPWLQTLTVLAKVCPVLGNAEHAAYLCDRLGAHHSLVPTFAVTSIEPVAYHLGLLTTSLGRYDEAHSHFEEATQIAERMAAPHWLARTRLEWARMLVRRAAPGDVEHARDLAGAALVTAEELGMARVAEQARALTLG